MISDAQKLGKIYMNLQIQMGELFQIMERHPEVKEIKDNLNEAMQGITLQAHKIYEQAHRLKKEEDKK